MNYFITGAPRSGTTYLGELLQLNGLKYWNELFTPEICRRRNIWDHDLDDELTGKVVDLAFSKPDSGFKMPYNPGNVIVYAHIALRRNVRIIHILRENLLEQYASWAFLHEFGVSKACNDGSLWNTDGNQIKINSIPARPLMLADKDHMEAHFQGMQDMRTVVYYLFRDAPHYIEIHMDDLFSESGANALDFLGIKGGSWSIPNHVPTPRPPAHELFTNYMELVAYFRQTKWGYLFENVE